MSPKVAQIKRTVWAFAASPALFIMAIEVDEFVRHPFWHPHFDLSILLCVLTIMGLLIPTVVAVCFVLVCPNRYCGTVLAAILFFAVFPIVQIMILITCADGMSTPPEGEASRPILERVFFRQAANVCRAALDPGCGPRLPKLPVTINKLSPPLAG